MNPKPRKKKYWTLQRKQNLTGWLFLATASILIFVMYFWPMIQAFLLSFQSGAGVKMKWVGLRNYQYMLKDTNFLTTLRNNFIYLGIQVPIMLTTALILATALNNPKLKFRGFFRTAIFLPCATSLVSYSLIFRSLFALDGMVNSTLMQLGIIKEGINWLANVDNPAYGRFVIIIALLWRWTGYNMIFYLAGLQNIDHSIYEAARIDGASPLRQLFNITMPLLKPTILLTAIISTNGTLQLFDESYNMTAGGPGHATMTMSHYIYNTSFAGQPRLGYAAAVSFVIFALVAILSFIQIKVGDRRD